MPGGSPEVRQANGDRFHLDGAGYRLTVTLDLAAAPDYSSVNATEESAQYYAYSSASLSFYNRPDDYSDAELPMDEYFLFFDGVGRTNLKDGRNDTFYFDIVQNFVTGDEFNGFWLLPTSVQLEPDFYADGDLSLPSAFAASDIISVNDSRVFYDQDSYVGYDIYETVGNTFAVTVVPVPAAVWLFASALAGLGFYRKRRGSQPRFVLNAS